MQLCLTKWKCFFLFLLLLNSISNAQSKKEIKKYKISSTTETLTEWVAGKEVSRTELSEIYDNNGNVIESTEYNKDGSFKKKESRKYNKSGEITEEVKYSERGTIISKTIYSYNANNDKVTEQTFDVNGKLVEWIKYGYDSLNQKIFELQLDEQGKVLKKSMYTYTKNGLRKEKKTYNGKEELISVKKYMYNSSSED